MFLFGKKKADPRQPNRDWPWALNLGGVPSPQLNWDILESELRKLNLEEDDSFLILEQKDPADPESYWFIQSAINRAGPRPGWYTVEEVIPYFRAAYDRKAVDLSKFQDMSDMLG